MLCFREFVVFVTCLMPISGLSSARWDYLDRHIRQSQTPAPTNPSVSGQTQNSGGSQNSGSSGIPTSGNVTPKSGSSSSGSSSQLSQQKNPQQFIDPSFSANGGSKAIAGSFSQGKSPNFLDPSVFIKGNAGGSTSGGSNPVGNGGGMSSSSSGGGASSSGGSGVGSSMSGSGSSSGGSSGSSNALSGMLQPPKQFINPGGVSSSGNPSGGSFSFIDPSRFLG